MDAFLEILRLIFWSVLVFFIVVIVRVWVDISIDTYITTKENNILIKDMCIKNEINVDSVLNIHQNDTLILNLKIDTKGE